MRREHVLRKIITDIIVPMEEDLIDQIGQKVREGLQQKPNWSRGEINDLFIQVIQEVKNDRRQLSDP